MQKVLILIAAVLLTTAVHASGPSTYNSSSSGPHRGTFTAAVLCTPSFEITIPGTASNEVYIGTFYPDGITHTIVSDDYIIKWELHGPAKEGTSWNSYIITIDNLNSNSDDGMVSINTHWRIRSDNHNSPSGGFPQSSFYGYTDLHLSTSGGNCDGLATFEIIAYDITADITAQSGRRHFHTTLSVSVSI